jgi:hypothetical protein
VQSAQDFEGDMLKNEQSSHSRLCKQKQGYKTAE